MTTTNPTQPLTTADLLFGQAEAGLDALAEALDQQDVLAELDTALWRVSQAGREAADREIATVTHGLFDLDLGDLLVAGWRKHAAVTTAVERTRATPGSSEVVELASHRITSVYRPFVEVLVNDVRVATIRFELAIEFLVEALVATVRDGHLVSLRSGACTLTAKLAAEGAQLLTRQAHLDLPLLIRLPVRIQPPGDPQPSDTTSLRILSPPWRSSRVVNHAIGRRHRRPKARQGLPAEKHYVP
jgi:hypothetical protein